MNVGQLIRALEKMPKRAKVCFVAHDQDPHAGEFDGDVRGVEEAPEALRARGYGVALTA